MSDKNTGSMLSDEEVTFTSSSENPSGGAPAYMNRLFCSTAERVVYVIKSSCSGLNLGQYDTGSDLYLYKIYGLSPTRYAKAYAGLGIYDMINDPLSAAIIDNMRSRWGKFKPFQYLSLLPSVILGFLNCMLPFIASAGGYDESKKLWAYMAMAYIGETVNAFFGGGGYIDNVFTPNPNERTSLLVAAKFVSEFFSKFPAQLAGLLLDLIDNGKLDFNLVKTYVIMKTVWWVIATVPGIMWTFVSKERVPQSKKPPHPLKGLASVFTNKPLLIYTLAGVIGGIDIGTSESLYYSDVLHFNLMQTIAGIPGMPISYASYPIATKLRAKFSTKSLWIMQCASITVSESLFFLVGCIGGSKNGFYRKKIPMTIAASLGNCIEMFFYGTKKIVGDEINFEVLDYCEWKNGYRVEATINLLRGYFDKIKGIVLKYVNAALLENWAGYKPGVDSVQSDETQWKMFLTACGPKLIFGMICIIPMIFYNIDKKTRERMYLDLERTRAITAARNKRETDEMQTGENIADN